MLQCFKAAGCRIVCRWIVLFDRWNVQIEMLYKYHIFFFAFQSIRHSLHSHRRRHGTGGKTPSSLAMTQSRDVSRRAKAANISWFATGGHQADQLAEAAEEGAHHQRDPGDEGAEESQHRQLRGQVKAPSRLLPLRQTDTCS